MDKKKILIIVGVVAVAGIGFYLWNKSKKTAVNEINKKTLWICLISVPFALIYKFKSHKP